MDIVNVIKAHPVPIIGGVIGLIVLIGMRGGSSGSSAGNVIGASLESQRIATAANVQISGINAQAATARGAQVSDLYKSQLSAAGEQAKLRTMLMGEMWQTQVGASTTLALDQNKGAVTRLLGAYAHEENMTVAANQLALGQKGIDAGVKMASEKLATDIRLNQDTINGKLSALAKTTELSKYQTDVTAANLPAMLANSQYMAKIAASNQQALAQMSSNTAQIISANQTQGQKAQANKTDSETAGNWMEIAGTIFSMFG